MAAEAEASREARAKVIAAEGEQKASRQLKEAADVIAESPIALQLRYLQTLTHISAEKNSTIIFPIPGQSSLRQNVTCSNSCVFLFSRVAELDQTLIVITIIHSLTKNIRLILFCSFIFICFDTITTKIFSCCCACRYPTIDEE